jgi:hypothetical protein
MAFAAASITAIAEAFIDREGSTSQSAGALQLILKAGLPRNFSKSAKHPEGVCACELDGVREAKKQATIKLIIKPLLITGPKFLKIPNSFYRPPAAAASSWTPRHAEVRA